MSENNFETRNYIGLNKEFSNSLTNTGLNLFMDYVEFSIDTLLQEEILKDIPIVGSIVSLGKVGFSVKEFHFTKKILTFLSEFHNGEINEENFLSFKQKFDNDIKYRDKVTNHILIFLDRFLSEYKAKVLARLIKAHINNYYDWDTFIDLSVSIDSMLIIDFKVIKRLNFEKNIKIELLSESENSKYLYFASIERLKAIGFIEFKAPTWEAISDNFKQNITLSNFGKDFYNLCLDGDF